MAALLIGLAVVSLVLILAVTFKKVGRNAPRDSAGATDADPADRES